MRRPAPASSPATSPKPQAADEGEKKIEWSPDRFDAGYYSGERKGLNDYQYTHPKQQAELSKKRRLMGWMADMDSFLFVGCARGFEVKYFQRRDVQVYGVDVSRWAIDNAEPEVKHLVQVYDGSRLPFAKDEIEVVAAFDVLTLNTDEVLIPLIAAMCRVASHGIVFRSHCTNHREPPDADGYNGLDGVHYRYRPFEWWIEQFEKSGKFVVDEIVINERIEGIWRFRRRT